MAGHEQPTRTELEKAVDCLRTLGHPTRLEKKHEAWEESAESRMPPLFYLAPHRDARLSQPDRELLRQWAQGFTAGKPEREDD